MQSGEYQKCPRASGHGHLRWAMQARLAPVLELPQGGENVRLMHSPWRGNGSGVARTWAYGHLKLSDWEPNILSSTGEIQQQSRVAGLRPGRTVPLIQGLR